MYTIPDNYMKPFLVVHCDECGSEHAFRSVRAWRMSAMAKWWCRRARDRRLRDAGVVVGTLAYQRAMNKGTHR